MVSTDMDCAYTPNVKDEKCPEDVESAQSPLTETVDISNVSNSLLANGDIGQAQSVEKQTTDLGLVHSPLSDSTLDLQHNPTLLKLTPDKEQPIENQTVEQDKLQSIIIPSLLFTGLQPVDTRDVQTLSDNTDVAQTHSLINPDGQNQCIVKPSVTAGIVKQTVLHTNKLSVPQDKSQSVLNQRGILPKGQSSKSVNTGNMQSILKRNIKEVYPTKRKTAGPGKGQSVPRATKKPYHFELGLNSKKVERTVDTESSYSIIKPSLDLRQSQSKSGSASHIMKALSSLKELNVPTESVSLLKPGIDLGLTHSTLNLGHHPRQAHSIIGVNNKTLASSMMNDNVLFHSNKDVTTSNKGETTVPFSGEKDSAISNSTILYSCFKRKLNSRSTKKKEREKQEKTVTLPDDMVIISKKHLIRLATNGGLFDERDIDLNSHENHRGTLVKSAHKRNIIHCECGKDIRNCKLAILHNRTFKGEGPFQCDQCGKFVETNLDKHLKWHKSGHVLCEICNIRVRTINYHTHKCSRPSNAACTRPSNATCKICGKTLKNRFTLKKHMTIHSDRLFQCPTCGENIEISDWQKHLDVCSQPVWNKSVSIMKPL